MPKIYSKSDKPIVSFVIRTKNEEKWLGKVLEKIFSQTFKKFEVIIVDSGSNDKTLKIAKCFPTRIFKIKPEEFSYSYALNFGVSKAKGKYIAILSGHSVPVSNKWLEEGLKNFKNPKVAGVDGYVGPLPDASFWKKISDGHLWAKTGKICKKLITYLWKPKNKPLMNTNSLIRKSLWRKYPFDELLPHPQCEDYDWSKEMWARGYITIRDPNLTVKHSHGLSWKGLRKRRKNWGKVVKIINKRKRPRKSYTKIKISD